jgi:hypothetical protein
MGAQAARSTAHAPLGRACNNDFCSARIERIQLTAEGNAMKLRPEMPLHANTALSVAVLAVLSHAPAAEAQTTDTWSLGKSGLWNVATDWSAKVVPNNGTPGGATYNVDIVDGKSTVTLNINAAINDLTMGAGNVLAIPTGQSLTIVGPTIANAGSIQVDGGGGNNAILGLAGNLTLSGAGTLSLTSASGGGLAYIDQTANGVTLTNQSTIQGAGVIGNGGLALTNSGTIDATASASGAALVLNGGGNIANTGLLEATSGGTLSVQTNVTNTGAGALTASGTGSVVSLNGIGVAGGTLTATGGGALTSTGTTTLTGVTLASGTTYPIATGTETVLDGSFTNKGTVAINGGAGNNAILGLASNITLGTGLVTMNGAAGGGNAYIYQTANGVTLTNQSTIQGSGVIGNGGLAVTNSGTINANSAAGTAGILLNGGGNIANTGLLEATNGGTLSVATNVTNTGAGAITASGTGSVVSLDGVTVTGGTLTATGGGALTTPGTNTLAGVTVAAGTTYPIATGSTTVLDGSFANKGTIQLNGGNGNNAALEIGTNVSQGGTVTLSSASATGGGFAYIQQAANGLTLTNTGTTQGSGVIGNGGLGVVNATTGIIDANATGKNEVTQLYLNGGGGVTNKGLIEATNGDTLFVETAVVDTGGKITASGTGSTVSLIGANITGGTLTTSTGGAMTAAGSTTLNGVAIASGSTVSTATGNTTVLAGTINNAGTLVVSGGAGNNAALSLANSVTLTGGGSITLASASGGGAAYIEQGASGLTLTNTNDTIQGDGIIGNGGLTVANGGTISSNVSGGTLVLNGSGGLTNTGTLKVGSGALLQVTSGPFTNFSGTTLSGGNYNTSGTLEIDELGTAGGEIVTNAAGITLNGTTAKFVDAGAKSVLTKLASNTATGSFTVSGGATYTTAGNFNNLGTLAAGSGSTFAVTGKLANFSGTTLTGGTYTLGGILKFGGANVVTNDAAIALTDSTGELVNSTNSGNGLANFATNGTTGSFGLSGGANFTTVGAFTNDGTLSVGSGSTFKVNGALSNVSGGTLKLGTYAVSGTFEFAGANIVTNAANLSLSGSAAKVLNSTTNTSGLANFAANSATGVFSVASGANFTTAGAFTNAGALSIGTGTTFKTGGTTAFTQTAGSLADDGTLAAAGGVTLSAGTLAGVGSITGNLKSTGSVTPGDSTTKTGTLTDTGVFTQSTGGSLNIGIGGTTKFDALKSTTAVLGGTLNISELGGFVPTVGSTFKILNFNSETGTFATVNGLTINGTEKYTITYQPTDVLLTVVSGAAAVTPTASGAALAPSTRAGRLHVAYLGASEDGAARLTATLREFNAAHALATGQSIARGAAFSGQAKAKRLDSVDSSRRRGR